MRQDITHQDRRRFLACAATAAGLTSVGNTFPAYAQSGDPWAKADAIVSSIALPSIPARDFRITSYGAVGNGSTDCTGAISRAIAAAVAAGGGRVVAPPGTFLTGPVRLKSRINLHLMAGATLRFKSDPAAYLPVVITRFGGQDCFNYSPLIYARSRSNIAITGTGTIDGGADLTHWWPWRGDPVYGWKPGQGHFRADIEALRAQGAEGVPVTERVYGGGHYLRPSLIQPYGCSRFLIDGVTLRNAPWWMIHPLFSSDITIRNVRFDSRGPNNDGCDLECCSRVLIQGCTFRQVDDKVVLKSGFGRDGVVGAPGVPFKTRPTRDVVVRDCRVSGYGAALAVGSEMGGGAENVFAERLVNETSDEALSLLLLVKSSTYRGGTGRGIWMRNANIAACNMECILLTYTYNQDNLNGSYLPRFENVNAENIVCGRSRQALKAVGQSGMPIVGLTVRNSAFTLAEKGHIEARRVQGFAMSGVTVNGAVPTISQ